MGQVTVRKVVEGPTNLTLRVDLLSDGNGELSNEVIFSPEDLVKVPVPKLIPTFRLLQVWYSFIWFDVTISVNSLIPQTLWPLSRDAGNHADFRSFGGLVDPEVEIYVEQPPNTDGKLLLSTNDFLAAGSIGTLVMELRLTNAASS